MRQISFGGVYTILYMRTRFGTQEDTHGHWLVGWSKRFFSPYSKYLEFELMLKGSDVLMTDMLRH